MSFNFGMVPGSCPNFSAPVLHGEKPSSITLATNLLGGDGRPDSSKVSKGNVINAPGVFAGKQIGVDYHDVGVHFLKVQCSRFYVKTKLFLGNN